VARAVRAARGVLQRVWRERIGRVAAPCNLWAGGGDAEPREQRAMLLRMRAVGVAPRVELGVAAQRWWVRHAAYAVTRKFGASFGAINDLG